MNNRYLLNLLLLVSIISIISLSILLYNKSRVLNLIMDDCNKYSNLFSKVNDRFYEINSMGCILEEFVLHNEYNEHVNILDALDNDEKLVFRFSTLQCDSCFESQLEILGDILKDGDDLIMIVNNDANIREINLINKRFSINVPVYKLRDDNLPLPIDSIGKPYYFKISEDLTPSDYFIPDKAFPELSLMYLSKIF